LPQENTGYLYRLFVIGTTRGIYYLSLVFWTFAISREFGAVLSKDFNLVTTFYAFLLLVCGYSIETGLIYLTQKHKLNHIQILNTGFLLSIFAGILAALFTVLFGNFFNEHFTLQFKTIPWQAFAYVTCALFTSTCIYLYQLNQKVLLLNIVLSFFLLGSIYLIFYIPFFKEINNYGLYHFGSLIVQVVLLYFMFFIFYKQKPEKKFLNKLQLKKVFNFSALVFVTNFVTFFIYRIDYYLLEDLYKKELENSNYNFASRLVQMIIIISVIIAQIIFPDTVGNKDAKASYRNTKMVAKYMFIFFSAICFTLPFVGKFLFPYLLGKEFNTMYKDLFYLIPGIIAQGVSTCFSAYLMGKNKIRVVLEGCTIALLLIICGDFIFLRNYGTTGAAIISSIGYTAQCFYSIYYIEKHKNQLTQNEPE
jgi:O-antigen/teichoic acid export membrane protein